MGSWSLFLPPEHSWTRRFGLRLLVLVALGAVGLPASGLSQGVGADEHGVGQQAPYEDGQVLVRLQAGVDSSLFGPGGSLPSYRVLRSLVPRLNIFLVALSADQTVPTALQELEDTPGVEWAQADHLVTARETFPTDPNFYRQWGSYNVEQSTTDSFPPPDCPNSCGSNGGGCTCTTSCITFGDCCYDICSSCDFCPPNSSRIDSNAPAGWDYSTGDSSDSGPVLAIIDSGFQYAHPDLAQNVWVNPGEVAGNGSDDDGNGYVDDIRGWNAYGNNANLPSTSHGTQVAGIIGARAGNNIGVSGLNWTGRMMLVAGSSGNTSTVATALNYVLDQKALWLETDGDVGANVIAVNMSFGVDFASCNSGQYPTWNNLFNALGGVGVLSVGATINSVQNVDQIGDVPTGCSSPFHVAVTNHNANGSLSGAGFGATTIDLAAPGSSIYTTTTGSGYSFASGTSFAAPHVTGAFGLMYDVTSPSWKAAAIDSPGVAALELKAAMLDHVAPSSAFASTTVSGGRLDIGAAVESLVEDVCAIGTPCNDGDACTVNDACNAAGVCAGSPVVCDDGDACTSSEGCVAGGCPVAAVECDDANACTVDSCNPSSGCVFTPVLTGDCAPPPGVCALSGAALSTVECRINLARLTQGMPSPTSLQLDLLYDDSLLQATGFQDEVCIVPGLCLPQSVPPSALSSGHSLSLQPGSVSDWEGSGRILLANLNDPTSPVSDAYIQGQEVVGESEFVLLEFLLLETIPESAPITVVADGVVASSATALSMTGQTDEGLIVVALNDCDLMPGACDDGNGCTFDTCSPDGSCSNAEIPDCGDTSGIQITSVSPNAVEADATRVMTVSGANFPAGADVLVESGEVLSVSPISESTLLVEYISPSLPGAYDVTVFLGTEFDTLTHGLAVTSAFCPGVDCGECDSDVACVEGDVCTQDVCLAGSCVHDIATTQCCAFEDCEPCSLAGDPTGTGDTGLTDVQCSILLSLWMLSNKTEPPPTCLSNPLSAGDINCDGDITVGDVSLSVTVTLDLPIDSSLDANGNGCVDACEQL